MKLKYGAFTHKGHVRKTNQDCFFIPDENCTHPSIFMVADGMGGHNAGDIASKIAVEAVVNYFCISKINNNTMYTKAKVLESVKFANSAIIQFSKTNASLLDMGTTLTVACVKNNRAFIGHIGDSRAYVIKNGIVNQITRDHSLVQELYDNGTITKEQMSSHPNRNILTRALGAADSIDVDYYELELHNTDLLLLCTDGLNLYVDITKNTELFNLGFSVEYIVNELGQKALNAGGADNITIIAAQCTSPLDQR